jgi:hypothetical protein
LDLPGDREILRICQDICRERLNDAANSAALVLSEFAENFDPLIGLYLTSRMMLFCQQSIYPGGQPNLFVRRRQVRQYPLSQGYL